MQEPLQRPRTLRFDVFEMDLDSEELKKNGVKLKLRGQPFRMLATIAERNGNVTTYEELRIQFWSKEAIDNYKHSLGNSMLEIRKVLGDSANNPRYIKTVSRGYKFLVPVAFVPRAGVNGNGSSHSPTASLKISIQQVRQELINTSDRPALALLFYRCKGLLNQYPFDSDLPDLQFLMAHIQSVIGRSAILELANPIISYEVASLVFDDPSAISIPHPFGNGRWKTIGLVESVLIVVEHSVRRENGQQVVVIHQARRATLQERRFYEQARK